MVRLFAPLLLLLSAAVSGIIATPTPFHADSELAKRDITSLKAGLVQLRSSVQIVEDGVARISSTSSPSQIAVSGADLSL